MFIIYPQNIVFSIKKDSDGRNLRFQTPNKPIITEKKLTSCHSPSTGEISPTSSCYLENPDLRGLLTEKEGESGEIRKQNICGIIYSPRGCIYMGDRAEFYSQIVNLYPISPTPPTFTTKSGKIILQIYLHRYFTVFLLFIYY